jgi:hypothetical protein
MRIKPSGVFLQWSAPLLLGSSCWLRLQRPDTYRQFQQVLAGARSQPLALVIRSDRTKQDVRVPVGPFLLQFVVKDMLSNGRTAAYRP